METKILLQLAEIVLKLTRAAVHKRVVHPDDGDGYIFELENIRAKLRAAISAVEEGITLKSEMPYSWDACEFVRKVAALTQGQGSAAEIVAGRLTLDSLITEARKLCGMED